MKSTESLDDAGKSTGLSSATGETVVPGDPSIPENKRRRLVRGAVAFAPLVLTLRSGALAAASSCTGLKATANTKPSTQNPTNNRPGKIINATVSPQEGKDICVLPQQLTACDTNSTRVLTSSNLTTANSAPVVRYTNPDTRLQNNKTYLVCGTTNGPNQAFIGQTGIAILSSASVTSIGVA